MFPFTLQPSITPRLFVPERLSSDAVLFLVMVFVRHLAVTICFRRVDVTKPKKKNYEPKYLTERRKIENASNNYAFLKNVLFVPKTPKSHN